MSNPVRSLLLVVGITAALLVARPSHGIEAEARCDTLRLAAAARAASDRLACAARGLTEGEDAVLGCHGEVDERLESAFARIAARRGCSASGEAEAIDALVAPLVDDLLAALGEDAEVARCSAKKLRLAGRYVLATLGCQRRAVGLGRPVEARCLAKAAARLADGFDYAERRLACGAVGDAGPIQATLDGFTAAATTLIVDGGPAGEAPTGLAAAVVGGTIELDWIAPAPTSGKTHVRVLRRLNAPPVHAADPDAAVVFFGTASAAADDLAALLPTTAEMARTYHYAAFGCTAGGDCGLTASRTALAPTLVQALRAGGYVLHWRHAAATVCSDQTGLGTAATTMVPDWWKSCDASCGTATARQLDASGVAEATAIGEAFDTLGIPIGRVQSSEFCRNVDTAILMDFGVATETRQDITFFVYDEAGRCAASYALLATAPPAGSNAAIIGHAGFTCTVLASLAWSEAAIFKPDGAGGSTFVTRIEWDLWAAMS